MTQLIATALFALSMSTWAAAPPKPAPSAKPAAPSTATELIIWSGSTKESEADKQREEFDSFVAALTLQIEIKPRVVNSTKVKGLKPGFHVVAVGLCKSGKATDDVLGLIKKLNPDAYTRTVEPPKPGAKPEQDELAGLGCPEWQFPTGSNGDSDSERWKLSKFAEVAAGKLRMVALGFSYYWEDQGDFATAHQESLTQLFVIDPKKRAVVSNDELKSPSGFAEFADLSAKGQKILIELTYGDPACDPSGDRYVKWHVENTAEFAKTKIKLVKGEPTQIKEGSCGYAEEQKAVLGEGHESGD